MISLITIKIFAVCKSTLYATSIIDFMDRPLYKPLIEPISPPSKQPTWKGKKDKLNLIKSQKHFSIYTTNNFVVKHNDLLQLEWILKHGKFLYVI